MKKLSKQTTCRFCFLSILVVIPLSLVFPVDHTNPPVTGEIEAPQEVMTILRRSCYDCHSNETAWPWYSYVAPASWLVAKDVRDGRRHMNFSEWGTYNSKQQKHRQKGCGKMVAISEMPLWFYLPLHSEAALSNEDIDVLVTWSKVKQ